MTEIEKTNVTLRLSKEVVDKARELGLNLSAITESMLKTENLMKDEEVITPSKMRDTYRKVFLILLDILQEWDVYLKIGEEKEMVTFKDDKGRKSVYPMDLDYYLSPQGIIELCDDDGEPRNEWKFGEDWPVNSLYESDKLIESLVNRLYNQAKTNKEKMEKLNLLRNVLEKIKSPVQEGKLEDK
jgi:hypothetical protein